MRQLAIVHISDLHFGEPHFYQPPLPADGAAAVNTRPSLCSLLVADLNSEDLNSLAPKFPESSGSGYSDLPLVVAISGDLTETASTREFEQASKFVADLGGATVRGSTIAKPNIFIVPGNHDSIFTETDIGRRWYPYCSFYEQHTGARIDPSMPHKLTRLIDRADQGFVVAELNSAVYVQKGSPDAIRGQIDEQSLYELKTALKQMDQQRLRSCIRVAVVHHHPIVLPALSEPGRGYDAIVNSQSLLGLLQDFGFHVVVHGHKHYPHTFTYDAKCAWAGAKVSPITIVAGGTLGSRHLPHRVAGATNVYNYIVFKWDPNSGLARIRVVTRGLCTHDKNGRELLPQEWFFKTLAVEDNVGGRHLAEIGPFDTADFVKDDFEDLRKGAYQQLRLNMPVVEVMPSLIPGQEYEARLWIEGHKGRRDVPLRVEWSGGEHFPLVTCRRDSNPEFCATLAYWGPVLVQARLHFEDGYVATYHLYARLPSARAQVEASH